MSYLIKNNLLISNESKYIDIKTEVIRQMFDEDKIINCYDILEIANLNISEKINSIKLLEIDFPHKGNEKINPISCRLKTVENIFNIEKFNNIKKNGKYIKALKFNDENVDSLEDIDLDNSFCLIFKTRRATESFLQIERNLKIILKEISKEFNINIIF